MKRMRKMRKMNEKEAKTTLSQKQYPNTFDPEKPMFPISIVADTLNVHQRTLRIYDDENILVPPRSQKNRRLYSFNDIERGKFIQFMTRKLGINIAGIKIIIHLLKQQNILPAQYLDHINQIGQELNILKHED